MDDTQKDYLLREKLKVIKEELGEVSSKDDEIEKKQLGELIKIYKGKYPNNKEEIELLERVSINVSNNIHLNAFMIESIFDTSLSELKNVYLEAKEKLKPRDKELAS